MGALAVARELAAPCLAEGRVRGDAAGQFRQLLERMLGVRNPAPPVITIG
jgi:hypothetical protein